MTSAGQLPLFMRSSFATFEYAPAGERIYIIGRFADYDIITIAKAKMVPEGALRKNLTVYHFCSD